MTDYSFIEYNLTYVADDSTTFLAGIRPVRLPESHAATWLFTSPTTLSQGWPGDGLAAETQPTIRDPGKT